VSELERYRSPAPVRRSAVREFNRIQEYGFLERAYVDVEEQNAAYLADRRIDNGYELAEHLVQNAGQLNREVTAATRDNPGLEMVLRGVEEDVAFSARAIVRNYMLRRP